MSGLVGWFDVDFKYPDGQKVVTLSTSPTEPFTHWEHSLFYFEKQLKFHEEDSLEGSILLYQHPDYDRGIRVNLEY